MAEHDIELFLDVVDVVDSIHRDTPAPHAGHETPAGAQEKADGAQTAAETTAAADATAKAEAAQAAAEDAAALDAQARVNTHDQEAGEETDPHGLVAFASQNYRALADPIPQGDVTGLEDDLAGIAAEQVVQDGRLDDVEAQSGATTAEVTAARDGEADLSTRLAREVASADMVRAIAWDRLHKPGIASGTPLGVSDSGHAWETAGEQTINYGSNGLVRVPANVSGSGWAIAVMDVGTVNADVAAPVYRNNEFLWRVGIVAAYVDLNNFVYFHRGTNFGASTTLRITKVVGGTATTLDTVTGLPDNLNRWLPSRLSVVESGSSLRLVAHADGARLAATITGGDYDALRVGTKAGFMLQQIGDRLADIVIRRSRQ